MFPGALHLRLRPGKVARGGGGSGEVSNEEEGEGGGEVRAEGDRRGDGGSE